jgi:hypothetical protein
MVFDEHAKTILGPKTCLKLFGGFFKEKKYKKSDFTKLLVFT